jgi:hypothetical protein
MNSSPPLKRRSTLPPVAVLLVGLAVLAVIGVVLLCGMFFGAMVGTRSGLDVSLQVPSAVRPRETLDVLVVLRNPTRQPVAVTDLSIDSSRELNFDQGFRFLGSTPPTTGLRETGAAAYYALNVTVAPGQEKTVRLRFKPLKEGVFRGMLFADTPAPRGGAMPLHTPSQNLAVTVAP